MVEEQRLMEEERQKMRKEHEKRVKEEQKKILGKNNSRPKLSFTLKPVTWVCIISCRYICDIHIFLSVLKLVHNQQEYSFAAHIKIFQSMQQKMPKACVNLFTVIVEIYEALKCHLIMSLIETSKSNDRFRAWKISLRSYIWDLNFFQATLTSKFIQFYVNEISLFFNIIVCDIMNCLQACIYGCLAN